MMGKPIVRHNGEWCLPVSFWERRRGSSAGMVVSVDAGETWIERGSCDVPPAVRDHDEHMLIERLDDTLWMLVRTKYGIGESVSKDGGRTWSVMKPSNILHVRSRFFVRRLKSGRLLLVYHDPGKDGLASIDTRGVRSHLTARLSEYDGRTWSRGLMLDERLGVSYPDGDQADDGTLYVTYDFQRKDAREILMAAFHEEDVLCGDESPGSVRLGVVVSKASRKSVCNESNIGSCAR